MKYLWKIFLVLTFAISHYGFSQEYPYETAQYQEFEKNPTYTLNDLTSNNLEYSHKGFLPGTGFINSDKIGFKHYFERIFSGAGVFISRNQINDSIHYTYGGISVAYRNILFDKALVKVGLTYKFVNNFSPSGFYDNSVFMHNDSILKYNTLSNFNASFSLSSTSDFYYVSVGICNVNPFGKVFSEQSPFLKQFHINAGNLLNIIREQRTNYLSVSYIQNNFQNGSFYSRGYFSTLYSTWTINRKTILKYGLSGGYAENRFYNISPFIYYLRNNYVIFLTNQFYISYKNFDIPYKYMPQINIIIKI